MNNERGDESRLHKKTWRADNLRLDDFIAFVREDSNLKPHAKQLIIDEAEKFQQVKVRAK